MAAGAQYPESPDRAGRCQQPGLERFKQTRAHQRGLPASRTPGYHEQVMPPRGGRPLRRSASRGQRRYWLPRVRMAANLDRAGAPSSASPSQSKRLREPGQHLGPDSIAAVDDDHFRHCEVQLGLRLSRRIDHRDRAYQTLATRRCLEKGPQLRARPTGIVSVDHHHCVAVDQVLLEIRPYLFGRPRTEWLRQYGLAADRSANLSRDLAMPRL